MAPEIIHVRGVGSLSQNVIKLLSYDFYRKPHDVRVQTSGSGTANLVYQSHVHASAALVAMSAGTIPDDPLQFRKAKKLLTNPTVDVEVRMGLITDIPASSRGSDNFGRRAPHAAPARKRNFEDDELEDGEVLDMGPVMHASMYDEDQTSMFVRMSNPQVKRGRYDDKPGYDASRSRSERGRIDHYSPRQENSRLQRPSVSSIPPRGDLMDFRRERGDSRPARDTQDDRDDLFLHKYSKDKQYGLSRNRSASPIRDGDGRFGFTAPETVNAFRERSPYRRPSGGSDGKAADRSESARSTRPSISIKGMAARRDQEMTIEKTSNVNGHHRRTDAIDAADSHGRDLISRFTQPPGRLADRITGVGNGSKAEGLAARITRNDGTIPDLMDMDRPKSSFGFGDGKKKDLFEGKLRANRAKPEDFF